MAIRSKLLPELYFGHLKDPKDERDYTLETFANPNNFTPLINASSEQERAKQTQLLASKRFAETLNEKFNINEIPMTSLSLKYDIISMLTKIRNQLNLGSCTAFSASCPTEYILKTINGTITQISTLFTYKITRNLMKLLDGYTETGDTGAFLRSTIRSLAMYGFVPERIYPYDVTKFDNTISDELKEVGNFFKALRYLRVDHAGIRNNREAVINDLKKWSWYEVPIIFGFTCYDSCLAQAVHSTSRGKIPFPDPNALQNEVPSGGHAITIVGYDDNMTINNFSKDRTRILSTTKGAFIIRNSWGTGWGNVIGVDNRSYQGYGYLPYEYVRRGLAMDFWVLLSQSFLDLKQFEE